MPPLRLRTLGTLQLDGPDGLAVPGVRRRELAVLAYLSRHSPGPLERERLAAVFWGEREESRARQSLRQILFRLRGLLGPRIEVTAQTVALGADAIVLDAAEFEADVAGGHLARAVERYAGEFLHGAEDAGGESFRVWLEAERVRLAKLLSWSLSRLVEEARARSDWVEAERWAEQWTAAFPLEEAGTVALLEALERQGRHAQLHARRESFRVRLRQELGIEPTDARLHAPPEPPSATTTRPPASAALLAPDLVGRDGIISTFDGLWRSLRLHGASVLLEGEAGIGKTRLAGELGRRAATSSGGSFLLSVRAQDGDEPPFGAARRLFAPLRRASGISGASDQALAQVATLVPTLRERFPTLPHADATDDRLLSALREVLGAVGEEKPILLAADDFVRFDSRTRELLLALASDPPPAVFVLLTARSEELHTLGRTPGLDDSPVLARIKLQRLDATQVDALVASMVELSSDGERRELAARVYAESDGLPFYAVELVSALADSGVLGLNSAGRWWLTGGLQGATLPLPATVDEAIRRRLDALSPAARNVLEAAAVLGQQAETDVLEPLTGVPADVFATGVAELVACRMLRSNSEPQPHYEFTHAMIRRSVYERLPSSRRRSLHAAAAAALQAVPGDRPDAVHRLRYHREQAAGALPRRLWLRGRTRMVTTLAFLIVLLAVAGYSRWRRSMASAADLQSRVIVLPFENLTRDAELGALSRIISDWIGQAIARTALARVAPPPEDAYGTPASSALEAALEQARYARADIAIRGRYQQVRDSLRVIGEIVEVSSGRVLGVAGPVAADPRDPMRAIDAMSERVLAVLSPWVDPRLASGAGVQSRPPTYASYRAFAEGLDHYYARRGELALPQFLRAYALDTTYTLPLLYAVVQYEGFSDLRAADSLLQILRPRRSELAPYDRAIFDYELAMVGHDWRGMYAAAQAAADIAPASLMAVSNLPRAAMALNYPGRAVQALSAIDPDRSAARGLPAYWNLLAHALHMTGDFEQQLAVALEVRRRFPLEHRALSYQARALAALGRLRELDAILAESWLLPSIPEFGSPGFALHGVVAQELAAHGYRDHARIVLERALAFHASAPRALMRVPRHAFEVARALYHLDRLDDARAIFEELKDDGIVGADANGYLGLIAVLQRDEVRAVQLGEWLREEAGAAQPDFKGAGLEYLARMAALQERRDEAVRLLRQAMAAGREYDSGKHLIWEFASLRGYSPFEEWLRPKS